MSLLTSTIFVDHTKSLSILGGAFIRNFGTRRGRVGGFERGKPQKFKCLGGMLKLRLVRRIISSNCDILGLSKSCLGLQFYQNIFRSTLAGNSPQGKQCSFKNHKNVTVKKSNRQNANRAKPGVEPLSSREQFQHWGIFSVFHAVMKSLIKSV